jgi:hypothetical protein
MSTLEIASPVRLHHVPRWLARAWCCAVREGRAGGDGARWCRGWAVADAIRAHLDAQRGHSWGLDHWGSTRIDGLTAFVNEPYQSLDTVRVQMEHLADLVGGVAFATSLSHWGHGTVRGLLLPPPELPKLARPYRIGWRHLLEKRICPWCLALVPEAQGVYFHKLRAVCHQEECSQRVACLGKDCSRSRGGKLRTSASWKRAIEDARTVDDCSSAGTAGRNGGTTAIPP